MLQIWALDGIREIVAGDDLVALIGAAADEDYFHSRVAGSKY